MKDAPSSQQDAAGSATEVGRRSLEAIVAQSGITPSKFLPLFRRELRSVPDPDRAANNFLRFISTGFTSLFLAGFLENPKSLSIALTLFGHSQYLADILVRNPELFHWLLTPAVLGGTAKAEDYRREARLAVAPFERIEKKMDALKRFQRREILRVSARDILGMADVSTVTQELSWLADSIVDTVVSTAFEDLNRRLSADIKPAFSVVGLGKLGGEELNFSSDIDLMFVYDQDGDLDFPGERIHSYYEYYCRAAESIVRSLTEHTAEGHLYRVDMRLRPDGASGPLAMARHAYGEYYESRGELWERQMLLKARIIAGDKQTGEQLLKSLRPFVHPSTTLRNPLDEIKTIKNRIESSLGDKHNVKLSRGGIRDIEFIVQALQLLKSGSDESIRDTNTLKTINKLRNAALLSEREARDLKRGYEFLRRVEHRLQLLHGTQTHELPGTREELQLLGERMGFKSTSEFGKELAREQARVRKIYDSVFRSGDVRGNGFASSSAISPVKSRLFLSKAGFAVPDLALKALDGLQKEFEPFRNPRILKFVLGHLKRKGAPDWGLKNFVVLTSSPTMKRILSQAFENERTLQLLLTICSRSSRVARTLCEQPLLLESLLGRTGEFLESGLEWEFFLPNDPVRFRLFNEAKAAIRYLAGDSSIEQVTVELTAVADFFLRKTLDERWAKSRNVFTKMCIVALGKFGGIELLPGSDLDLLMLYRHDPDQPESEYQKEAAELPGLFKSDGSVIYSIDLRLRPEGKNAPLATDFSYYEQYLAGRAELWEKQSLLKARVVYDKEALGEEFTMLRTAVLSGVVLQRDWIRDIRRMRRKMEEERTKEKTRAKDLKVGKGGLLDLEFAVQAVQLRHFKTGAPIDSGNTLEATRQFGRRRLLKRSDLETLSLNYKFMRELEFLIKLNSETNDFVIPDDASLLRALAAGLGMRSVPNLLSKIRTVRKENRVLLRTVLATVAQ